MLVGAKEKDLTGSFKAAGATIRQTLVAFNSTSSGPLSVPTRPHPAGSTR
jgi:hypothetical protein